GARLGAQLGKGDEEGLPVRWGGGSGGLADGGEAALARAGRGLHHRAAPVGLAGRLYDLHVQGHQALIARQPQELMVRNSVAVRLHRTPPGERRLQAAGLSPPLSSIERSLALSILARAFYRDTVPGLGPAASGKRAIEAVGGHVL